jgi:hypothetical protein
MLVFGQAPARGVVEVTTLTEYLRVARARIRCLR